MCYLLDEVLESILFISPDTEGSFFVQRCQEMAEAAVAHVRKLAAKANCQVEAVQVRIFASNVCHCEDCHLK